MTDRPSSAGAPRRSKPWPHRRWLGWLVLGALILLAGAQFDFSRRAETLFTLLLVPALATLLGIVDLWKTRGALRAAALAVLALFLLTTDAIVGEDPDAKTAGAPAMPEY